MALDTRVSSINEAYRIIAIDWSTSPHPQVRCANDRHSGRRAYGSCFAMFWIGFDRDTGTCLYAVQQVGALSDYKHEKEDPLNSLMVSLLGA